MSKKTHTKQTDPRPTIGLLMGRISGEQGTSTFLLGVADAAEERDANVITFAGGSLRSPHGFEAQGNVIYDLVSAGIVDGLSVDAGWLGHHVGPAAMQDFCNRYRDLPLVSVEVPLEGMPSVLVDFYQGLRNVVTHLIEEHGYRRIAFIRGPEESLSAEERYRAYQDALAEHDIPLDIELVAPGTFFAPSGEEAVRLLLDERRVEFEAVAAANDLMALDALQALQARGISVPDDVAVTGFDNEPVTGVVTPPLTTARLGNYERAWQGAEMVLDQLGGKEVPERVVLPAEVVVRQSCGCPSLAVVEAAAGPVRATGEALEVALAAQREQILLEMEQAAGVSTEQGDGWTEQLLDAFLTELDSEVTGVFLPTLRKVLKQVVATGGHVATWQGVLSVLRRHVVSSLGSQEVLAQVEDLWQQARVLIGEMAERTWAYQNLQSEQQAEMLREVGQMLITTHDVAELMDMLVQELPRLGISSCYLSLYEDPTSPADWAKLVLAYRDGDRVGLAEEKKRFASPQLVPAGLLPENRRYELIVEPLYFREDQIGFVLFEFERGIQQRGLISEALRGQFSSALRGALLMQQEEKRARELQTVVEVSAATSTILDTADLLQQVVDLTKQQFGLYHAHIYLLNEAGDTLDLVAGAGEKGRKMVAEGWHIPLNREQSLVARAARNRQGEVVNDVKADPHWFANPNLPETKSEMAVPLIVGERVLGVLDVQSAELNHFTADDVRIQSTLATQVAVALENALLFAETTQSKKEAEQAKEKAEQARAEAEQAKKEIEVANQALEIQIWQTTGQAQLNDTMRGEQDIETLADNVISQLCKYLPAQTGALYIMQEDGLYRTGHYAYNASGSTHFKLREGLVGQAAAEREPIFLTDILPNQLTVQSGFGEAILRHVMAFPFMYEDQVGGVIELGTLTEFSQGQIDFIHAALDNIAIAFNTAQARERINELLGETQQQAEELQTQSEELRVANEELETQTRSLQASEAILKEKQAVLDKQNQELKIAQEELERKAEELALASKYKSEFLANMSHELRTPLNSLLILARMLADNKENNLTPEQIESAQIIHSGGTDLLDLINDILDLSKVEAGQMVFDFEVMPLTDLVASTHMQFDHVAEEKGVELRINLSDDLPGRINTDPQRLKQIVKNLLSNAFKFTKQGSVTLDVYRPDRKVDLSRSGLNPTEAIAISVADTGVGMTPEQLQVIFEAFQQADGSTSRQYGGTGLGLSISRELAANLGGQIDVTSEPGQGSTFTLYLPIAKEGVTEQAAEPSEQVQPAKSSKSTLPQPDKPTVPKPPPVTDDRDEVALPDERDETTNIVAIIEDDPNFATVVYNYAHKKGFKCLIAGEGQTGLDLVQTYQPDAVILDLNLPDMSGWEVLTTLKNDPAMRHIPVHIMSADDEDLNAFKKGAMGYLTKPVSQEHLDEAFGEIEHFISQDIKALLLVEDDANSRASVKKLLDGSDVQINEAENGQQALDLFKGQSFDCMILDLSLPDMSGFEVLNKINDDDTIAKCPVIIYTGRDLTPEENMELMQYADRVIVKGVKSPERLLDETALFLHRVVAEMPQEKQQTIKQLYSEDELLKDKTVLVVDDDMRNSFALSKLLSDKGITVKIAKDGQKALDMLDEGLEVDLILMDIMMPVMDGYETTKRIRAQQEFSSLPILALTAKAMKGDREKCFEAGASDYLPKPVDVDRLFSMLRVWLYQ